LSKINIKLDFLEGEVSKIKEISKTKDYIEYIPRENRNKEVRDSDVEILSSKGQTTSPSKSEDDITITKTFESFGKTEKPKTKTFTSTPAEQNETKSMSQTGSNPKNGFKTFQSSAGYSNNRPIMPGNGFAQITPEFLYKRKNNADSK